MIKRFYLYFSTLQQLALICLYLSSLSCFSVYAETRQLSLAELLQDTLKNYPSLESAELHVIKAQQASIQIESQLGWQLGAQLGIHKNVSLFGIPVLRLQAAGQLQRQLASGDSIAISATLSRDDAAIAIINSLPNPVINSALEFEYRKPLAYGKNNSTYTTAIVQANSNVNIQRARQQQAYDRIAAQLIDLYAALLSTQQRINNIEQSILRNQRLQRFINNRIDLGIAENKDRLQTKAQRNGLLAMQQALEIVRSRQTIALNRLMGQPWQTLLILNTNLNHKLTATLDVLIQQTRHYSPMRKINTALLTIASSQVEKQKDNKLDRIDLVFSIGNRSLSGDTQSGVINDNELITGVQLDYGRTLNTNGNNAALYQAQLEKNILINDKKQIDADLHYDMATLLAELHGIEATIKAYKHSVTSEHAKLDEAEQRYRQGRITIDQVIRFENQTSNNELELALQKINHQHSHNKLDLLRGTLWKNINMNIIFHGKPL